MRGPCQKVKYSLVTEGEAMAEGEIWIVTGGSNSVLEEAPSQGD